MGCFARTVFLANANSNAQCYVEGAVSAVFESRMNGFLFSE